MNFHHREAAKSPKSRHRCFGKLYQISHWESRVFIAFKCKLAGKRMVIEIDGQTSHHIPADSAEYAMILPRLRILTCNKCGKRILDYFQVVGKVGLKPSAFTMVIRMSIRLAERDGRFRRLADVSLKTLARDWPVSPAASHQLRQQQRALQTAIAAAMGYDLSWIYRLHARGLADDQQPPTLCES